MREKNLTPWEWITLVGVICSCGVGVTVFAMTHFETAENSDKRETRLEKRVSRVETMQELTLRKLNIEVPPRTQADE